MDTLDVYKLNVNCPECGDEHIFEFHGVYDDKQIINATCSCGVRFYMFAEKVSSTYISFRVYIDNIKSHRNKTIQDIITMTNKLPDDVVKDIEQYAEYLKWRKR